MNVESYTYYYFVGVGGIGMSALARYFLAQNKQVLGYDKTATPLTDALQNEGISIIFEDKTDALPSIINPDNCLVIYTPAIKESNVLDYFNSHNFNVLKRSQALENITENSKCLAIAGTHGKTTTTTMLAYLLKESNFPAMAFLGGISENYNTNFISNGNEFTVVEADEFDRSFLYLSPYFATITSIDADHLDIYTDASDFQDTFQQFADSVKEEGSLFLRAGIPIEHTHISYGTEDSSDYSAQNIQLGLPFSAFDLKTPTKIIAGLEIQLQGKHNIENAVAALAMALELGVEASSLRDALKKFKGIKRRFSIHYLNNDKILIDDYAHHPKELQAAIKAVNDLFPDKKKLFVFQPHLYSRTRDFAEEFSEALSETEQLVLLDIYPAREKPIEGVNAQMLADKINEEVLVKPLALAYEAIQNYDYEVLVTLGAGNIDTLAMQIVKNQKV